MANAGGRFGEVVAISPLDGDRRRREGRVRAVRGIMAGKRGRRRIQCVLESAPDPILVFTESGEIVLVNTAAEKVFGYPRQRLIGQNAEMLIPERVRHRRLSLTRRWTQQPRPFSIRAKRRLTLRKAGGEEFPAEVSFGLVEEGRNRLICGLVRDVTEHLLLEEALRVKNLQLEEALQAKDRFLAALSHELRTPLNGILGLAGLVRMKLSGPRTAETERQLEIVRLSARHLLSIINDLLDLAKLTANNEDLHLERVPCGEVVEEVASALQPLAAEKGLALTVTRRPESVVLYTNRRFLRQILFNLTSNAVKYTGEGSVSLSFSVTLQAGRRLALFQVADTGVGISAEDQPRLFQEFTRLHAGHAPADSTGLGLHLSQKMAGLLGGAITVESQPGKGSVFTFTLPMPEEAEAAAG